MDHFGLELAFSSSKPLFKKEDCLVIFFHWKLVSNGFLCLHPHKDKTNAQEFERSELLPNDWNSDSNSYELHYVKNNQCYLLKALPVERELIFTFVRIEDEQIVSVTLVIDDWIETGFQSFKEAYKNKHGLEKIILKDLSSWLSPSGSSPFPSNLTMSKLVSPVSTEPSSLNRFPDVFPVGSGDLNPIGSGMGGGMLMDPRHQGRQPQPGIPGNLPAGAVPPGARFDPFGPPGTTPFRGPTPRGGFGDPDYDHLRPPGSDDMFM